MQNEEERGGQKISSIVSLVIEEVSHVKSYPLLSIFLFLPRYSTSLGSGLGCRLAFRITGVFCAFQVCAGNMGSAASQNGSFMLSTMIPFEAQVLTHAV